MVPRALSADPWRLEGHKAGGQHPAPCSPTAAPQLCHSHCASSAPPHPCPELPVAMLPSTALLQHWLLQSHPPPTSGTAVMQKAASKMLLGAGSAASRGWERRGPPATAAHARKRGLFCPETVPSSHRLWLCWPQGIHCPQPRQDGGEHSPPPAPAMGPSEQGPARRSHGHGFHLWGDPAQAVGKQSPWHQPPLGSEVPDRLLLTARSRLLPSLILMKGDKQGCTKEAALHTHLSSLTRELISMRPGQQHLPTHLQQHGRSLVQMQG